MKTALTLFFTLLVVTFIFLPARVSAASPSYIGGKLLDSSTAPAYQAPQNVDYTMLNILGHWGLCAGEGTDTYEGQDCLDVAQQSSGNGASTLGPKPLAFYKQLPSGGVLGGMSNVMIAMYTTPPASTTEYLAYVGNNLGIVQPAYAAGPCGPTSSVSGAGCGVIAPVLLVWQYMRNIAYLAFIILFLAVGFMIMFRQKINPQTVISVQAALPGLVMGLILVTFSYFISALLIDFSFLGMQIVAGVFIHLLSEGGLNIVNSGQIHDLATNGSIWDLFGSYIFNGSHFSNLAGPVKDAFQQIFPGGIFKPDNFIFGFVGAALGGALGLIAMLVIMIALIIQMFKLLWELVTAYITILITTVISPLIILGSSFPGRGSGLDNWWKTILANSLIFPVVFGAFLFAGMFLANTHPEDFQVTLPLFSGIPVALFRTLLGYGILLATPGIPKLVKEAFKVKDNPLGQVAQAGFMAGISPIRTGYRAGTRKYAEESAAWYKADAESRGAGGTGAGAAWKPWYRLFRAPGGGH